MIDDGDITEYRGHRIAPCPQNGRGLDVQQNAETLRCGLTSLADAALWVDQRLALHPWQRNVFSRAHADHDFALIAS